MLAMSAGSVSMSNDSAAVAACDTDSTVRSASRSCEPTLSSEPRYLTMVRRSGSGSSGSSSSTATSIGCSSTIESIPASGSEKLASCQ